MDSDVERHLSFDAKIKEYLRRKNIEKNGFFNDEIDIGGEYYQDFDYEENVEDRDNVNFYDYSDFIANSPLNFPVTFSFASPTSFCCHHSRCSNE